MNPVNFRDMSKNGVRFGPLQKFLSAFKSIRTLERSKGMQNGRTAYSEEEDAVFLSPERDHPEQDKPDQGASPQLRRSTCKRKSTAGGDEDMTKGSNSKKKKSSPPKMPKVPRSPAAGAAPQPAQSQQPPLGQSFEALLLAMEGRLSAKLEKASEASKEAALQAKLNSEGLEQLESRVDANESCLMTALKETELRIMSKVQDHVQEIVQGKVHKMVSEQLAAAGFDTDLTAADLSVRRSTLSSKTATANNGSYAEAAAAGPSSSLVGRIAESKGDRKETRFLVARRSLRLWPLPGGSRQALEKYLKDKLRLDQTFIKDDLGQVILNRPKEPKNKNKDEYIVIFETKQIRDAVKAAASNLPTSETVRE